MSYQKDPLDRFRTAIDFKEKEERKPRNKDEEQIQMNLCDWINSTHEDIVFISDASGIRMPIGLAKKYAKLKSCRGICDLIILEPRGNYHGLLIELKSGDDKIITKKGEFRQNDHLKEQIYFIKKMNDKGYFCTFACSFEEGRNIINEYLSL